MSDLRILHVLLKLREDTADTDAEIVEVLRNLPPWFNHVMLYVPSWQDKPDAANHPLVRRAVNICREQWPSGIPVIWGRWLWEAWPKEGVPCPAVADELNPAYYARAIATVKAEARCLDVAYTSLDVEPYAGCSQKVTLQGVDLTFGEQARIREAALAAVRSVGAVDFIKPTSSGRDSHFCWATNNLGKFRCDLKTYYIRAPKYEFPKMRPPQQCEHRIDVWGCNVGLGRPEDVHGSHVKLTVDDVKALDLSAIRWRYPTCLGVRVYADYDIFVDVVRNFEGM